MTVSVRTLGAVEVRVNGGPPPPELLWRKNLALLVYLASSDRRARARDHLTAMFWGDKEQSAGRHSLNEALRILRRTLGAEAVLAEGDTVALARGAVLLDVDELEVSLSAGDHARAASLAAGDFLEGFGVPGAADFEDWLAATRFRWRARLLDALGGHAEASLRAGSAGAARALAARGLALDPASERVARVAMRASALAGDRAAALAAYDALVAALADRTGRGPTDETLALADRVRREREWRHAARPQADAPGRQAPLAGREQELSAMLDVWAECASRRQPAAIVLEGDAGVGKTRLLDELLGRARLEGAITALARAVEADRGTALGALGALAQGGLMEARGLAAAPPAALAALAAAAPAWLERFPSVASVVPLPLPRAFAEVLRAVAEDQPVLLALDDAHLADDETLLALPALLRDLAGTPVLLALGALPFPRRDPLDALGSRLGREVPGLCLVLERLERASVAKLVDYSFPEWSQDQRDRLTRRVEADSAGVPLLTVELLNAVQAGLDLAGLKAQWPKPLHTLTQTTPGDLPDAIVAAIRVSYRRLSTVAQEVLAAASVLGDRTTERELAAGTLHPAEAVSPALDELEWRGWMVAEPRGYGFRARLLRTVIERDMLTPGQRRRIRERVGLEPGA